jgi:hypothetical protein
MGTSKEDEVGWACSTYGKHKNAHQIKQKTLREEVAREI